jgi:hypothetical protein
MDFTAVDLTLAGSTAITLAGSTAITLAGSTAITIAGSTAITIAGGASSVDFTHLRGGVITAPIRPATTPT